MAKRKASPSSLPSDQGPTSSKRPKAPGRSRTNQNVPKPAWQRAPPPSPLFSFAGLRMRGEPSAVDIAAFLFNSGQVSLPHQFDTDSDTETDSGTSDDSSGSLSPTPREKHRATIKKNIYVPAKLEKPALPDTDWWAPREHLEYTEDDQQYKLFRSRTVFESDALDPENYMRKPTVDQFDWKYEKRGDEKPKHWNQLRAKKIQSSGYRVVGDALKPRHSATEKFLKWRTTNFARDRPAQKYPRDIVLLEHEPLGVIGEAGAWSNSYSTLPFNANIGRGSSVALHIAVSNDPLNTCGVSVEWHKAIMTMLEKWTSKPSASAISIVIEDDSILTTDVTALYPTDPVEFGKRKVKIDEDVARAKKFVFDIRHWQETGELPLKELPSKRKR